MAYAGNDYMRDGELVLSNMSDYNLTPGWLSVWPATSPSLTTAATTSVGKLTPSAAGCRRTKAEKSHRLGDVRAGLVL